MHEESIEMRFDPKTINHLGVKMYSRVAPAIAELVSNSYDADSSKVLVSLKEKKSVPSEILIEDNGTGISFEEINSKFLVIGRNKRDEDGDQLSIKYKRLSTGKKGLGKLALFGLAKTITVTTIKEGKLNQFILDWDDLMSSNEKYKPKTPKVNESTKESNGTKILLSQLKRKTPFDVENLANSLAQMFIFDKNFKITRFFSDSDLKPRAN